MKSLENVAMGTRVISDLTIRAAEQKPLLGLWRDLERTKWDWSSLWLVQPLWKADG
jgi:hypothetical protein